MKRIFSQFDSDLNNKEHLIYDRTNKIAEIIYRFEPYRKLFWQSLKKRIPLGELIRARFPFLFPNPCKPIYTTVEFTNICNLICVYCSSHLGFRPQGMMSSETFSKFLQNVRELDVNRVHIVGNGEPTLHPEFPFFIQKLSQSVKYVDVVTNGQWSNESIPYELINAAVDRIDISVDAGGKNNYEKSRRGACFDKLIFNLKKLQEIKRELKASTLINIRLMLRPSQKYKERKLIASWSQFGDIVMRSPLVHLDQIDYDEDIYRVLQEEIQAYPKCIQVFNNISVMWNGDVSMCDFLLYRKGPSAMILGNIHKDSLKELFNCPMMIQYRNGHKNRNLEKIPFCKGCIGD